MPFRLLSFFTNYPVYPDAFIPQHAKQLSPTYAVWNRLCSSFLLVLVLSVAYGQNVTSPISLTQVSDDGFLLREGWLFQPGNNSNGARPNLDDRRWVSIDPTKDIRELPQLQQAGIGWLRLHIRTGPELPPLMIKLFQSIASEIYLDGRLLYRFGKVSANPDSVQAYNPAAAYSFPLTASSHHLLALRVAWQPSQFYYANYLNWDAGTVQFWLFPTRVLPAIKPVDVESIYLNTFRIGIAFILFILHLSLFFAHPSQRANLYAAGMYLLLNIGLLSRFATDFTHSVGLRILVYYGSRIDLWVPGLVVLTFYGLFNFRRGWLFWLAIGSIGIKLIPLSADFQWLSYPINYFLPLELIRLSLVAVKRELRGATIVAICAFCNLGLWILSSILFSLHIPGYGHEWLFHVFYLACFLCFPLTLSILLALEHGWVNGQLVDRIQEIETLSAQNLAQQHERQELLAQQNEQLERQVAERTQELHQKADQLRELDILKSRFVTNITHEFRTPLSLIISPVEKLLRESQFDRPALTLVQRNAGRLMRLINQLLDLSKLEGNHMAVSLMQGDVTDFIHHNVEVFQRLAEQQGVTLTGVVTVPAQAYAFDTDKWEKILTNLLANALKFTAAGGQVTVTATPVSGTASGHGVQIDVIDTGIGISPGELPHIFNRFYQADTSSTRAYGGTGIGLALVHELTGLLGGTIGVESVLGTGTTFRLILPLQPVSTAAGLPQTSWPVVGPGNVASLTERVPGLAKQASSEPEAVFCLLIVEDNDELREFLVSELTPAYQVLQAVDGEAGWALVQTELPDLVLTDVMMPRMDGYELTRLIKNNAATDHIAVVMLTAKAAQPSRLEGLLQGADDYLAKPFNVHELRLKLHNLLTRQQKLGDYYRQQLAMPTTLDNGLSTSHSSADLVTAIPQLADPFLQRIYALLEQHLDNPSVNVDWLADQLTMNRKTLYRKVQSLIQLAPADLIRQYRLRKAVDLLGAGRNVAETADLVGFSTPSHFTIVFKEFYQRTPTEFINSQKRPL